MSFLNFKIPIESLDSVLEEIRKQIEADRLKVQRFKFETESPTIEIKRLIEIVQREFQIDRKAGLVAGLVQVDHTEPFYVYEHIADGGSCFVICLEEFEDGGAYWTDMTRTCTLDRKTILKCQEGTMQAKSKGHGGVYLLLIDKPTHKFNY